jgi:drug/metabolite transporter (DMT)-like permease
MVGQRLQAFQHDRGQATRAADAAATLRFCKTPGRRLMKSNWNTILTHPLGIFIAALLATFLWGSAFPVVKMSYVMLSIAKDDFFLQIEFAGYRFVLAAIFLMLLMRARGKFPTLNIEQTRSIAKVAIVQTFLQYLFFILGSARVAASGVQLYPVQLPCFK